MKKIKYLVCIVLLIALSFSVACGDDAQDSSPDNTETEVFTESSVYGIKFDKVNSVSDPDLYASEVATNDPVDNGIIVCPYFSLKVGGVDIPVYSTRCGKGLHSFACIIVDRKDKTKRFDLDVELTGLSDCYSIYERNAKVVVLPEKRSVTAQINGDKVTTKIRDFGTFSFGFNNKSQEGLTLYFYEKEELNVPDGWNVVEIETGKHTVRDTTFANSNTVYVFKSGRHLVSSVTIPTNAWVYLEDGAYLEAYPEADENGEGDHAYVFRANGGENIKLFGHGLVDFSADIGGDGKIKKGVFNFNNSKNFTVKDIISINGNSWTLCFTNCENVYIEGVMIYGYRTYSDGIMLSDCRDSYVTKCFVRTGDDAMETKSTSSVGYTKNVTYYDNDCWTDKGLAYGVVWETNHDVSDVYFKNCSVGFAQPNWHEKLAALTIMDADHYYSVSNVHFEDIEIYRCECPSVINMELSDSGKGIGDIYFKNITCKYATGRLVKFWQKNMLHADASFGDFYFDNVSMNGVRFSNQNAYDKNANMMQCIITNTSWKPEEHVKIDTLG